MEAAVNKSGRMKAALYSMFAADALSMPVHWYYDTRALKRDFGEIRNYEAPKREHPSSIMNVSNTGGHGRGDQSGDIIGGVILHDKKRFWGSKNVHYHQGMAAGENTLNLLVTRVLMRSITQEGHYDPDVFLKDYVQFMTTPGTHNDTYAESYHRDFFANYAKGVPVNQCAGAEGHNTASAGGLVMLPLIVMAYQKDGLEKVQEKTVEHMMLTHRSSKLGQNAKIYAKLLFNVLNGEDLRANCLDAAKAIGADIESVLDSGMSDEQAVAKFGMACYIDSSFPALLYLAYKYAGDIENCLLANTNAGGENCHRGAALGAIIGANARNGVDDVPVRFREGLAARQQLDREIDAFVATCLP